jgi:cell division protein FtsA
MITALAPHLKNLEKVLGMTELPPQRFILAGLAAARAVLTDNLRENGVILIDIGGTTTNIAVYEEGDLVHTAVLPIGSNNITNDLAIGLKTDLDIAEKVKIEHAVAAPELRRGASNKISVKVGSGAAARNLQFDAEIIDEVVEARLAEIFELVNHELKKIKRLAKLPGGAVLTGGGAKLRGIADYAREVLSMNAHVGHVPEFGGMGDKVAGPEFATAIGLMLIDFDSAPNENTRRGGGMLSKIGAKIGGLFARTGKKK